MSADEVDNHPLISLTHHGDNSPTVTVVRWDTLPQSFNHALQSWIPAAMRCTRLFHSHVCIRSNHYTLGGHKPMSLCYRASMSAIALLGLTLAACGESKVAQCNRLIEVANSAVTAVQEVTTAASADDPEALNTIADTADQAVADMQGLEFADEQLQDYQQRFVAMYEETSRASRAIYTAVGALDNEAAQQAVTDLQTATGQETDLVNEVNTYCSAS